MTVSYTHLDVYKRQSNKLVFADEQVTTPQVTTVAETTTEAETTQPTTTQSVTEKPINCLLYTSRGV